MHIGPEIHRRFERQLGLVTRAQLRRYLTDKQIRARIRAGALIRVHAGVYRAPGSPQTLEHRGLAACLACGPDAVTSYRTAGALWGVLEERDGPVEIIVPACRRPRVPDIVIRRSERLTPKDCTTKGLVPITTVSRTLIDLAGAMTASAVEDVLDETLRAGLLTPRRLLAALEQPSVRRIRGSGELRRAVRDRLAKGTPESVLEARALRLLRKYGLPEPVRQLEVRVGGRRARFDLAYPDKHLAMELDGRAPHWGRERWQSDHDRHNATELAGYRTLRFTWADITTRELHVAMTVGTALGLRPSRWTSID